MNPQLQDPFIPANQVLLRTQSEKGDHQVGLCIDCNSCVNCQGCILGQ